MRNKYIDVEKGITIFLVSYAHMIENAYGHNIEYFGNETIHLLIYLFHMPFFALLSGYCLTFSIKKSIKHSLILRTIYLTIPATTWGMIAWVFKLINGEQVSLNGIFVTVVTEGAWFVWVIIVLNALLVLQNVFFRGGMAICCKFSCLAYVTVRV